MVFRIPPFQLVREVKDDNKVILEDKDLEVIGVPNVRYDDVTVIAQHMETGYWLSYKASTVRKKGVGMVEEKRLLLHEEGRMDDGVEFARWDHHFISTGEGKQ